MPTFLFRLFHLLFRVVITPVSIVLPSIFLHLLSGSVASSVLLYNGQARPRLPQSELHVLSCGHWTR